MISRMAQASALLALGSATSSLAANKKRRFKIGACDWSLRKKDASSFAIAKEIGLDGVQIDMGSTANGMWLRRSDVQKTYVVAARKSGVQIAGLAMGELNSVAMKSEPHTAIWLLDAIETAKAVGVKVVLVAQFPPKGDLKGDKAGIDRTVNLLKEAAPRAEKSGIILGLENYLSAEENLDILQRIGSPAVKVYYDVGNSTDKGYDIYSEIRILKGNICEFHAKDGRFMLGHGRINFHKVREAIDDIGYSGWIQIEAAAPHELIADYREQLAFLRKIF